ncbi:membrane-bound lytic murein transglycosylase MltF [Halomonas getboli]|uniref:membrane-bound lytic murein transglycosylase MltF n=1 Tax=Halomonas getboli TaxID=2935862 RepID=UPI0020001AC7|nr:membrane-bound lytic murein transglycosylase MltF [Halomonas getboli]MCK2184740.1 membrane-bound lytic murein transglycosylase MltF [Halomonas getboli]
MLATLLDHLRRQRRRYATLCALLGLGLVTDRPDRDPGPQLADIRARDFLNIQTRNTPTTYYEGRQGPTGFEYELMRRFADYLGVSLNLDADHNIAEALEAVRHQGDLGAAALPLDPTLDGLMFSRPIMPLQPLLVYRRGLPPPDEIDDLEGLKIGTLRGTGTSLVMHELQQDHPWLRWQEADDIEVSALLGRVADGTLDAAVVFRHQFRLNRLFFPEVEDGFALGRPLSLAWAFPTGQGLGLLREANRFLEQMQNNGLLARLETRYLGRDNYLEYVGARTFIGHVHERLPRYDGLFRAAARDSGFDWKLLAAVGYQESHWRPKATSPTGVRGMMMLTNATASEMNVANRLDPAQSIEGGARYLRSLKDRLPASITGDDRLYMALAAYNVGLGHLYDARRIVEMRGGNPDRWDDVRDALPLLQQREWYSKTRYGYARGGEPVIYVRNIRRYHEILAYVDRSRQQFHRLSVRQSPDAKKTARADGTPPSG